MPKRNLREVMLEDKEESINSLEKRIKLEHNYIIKRVKRANEDLDLSEHELYKFLLIFHTLIETVNLDDKELEEIDGVVTDIILKTVLKIADLIRQNIDALPFPKVLKDALKIIKGLFQNNAQAKTQSTSGATMEETIKERPRSSSSSSSSSSSGNSSSSTSRSGSSTTSPSSYSKIASGGSESSPTTSEIKETD